MSSDEDWGDWDKRPPPAAIPFGAAVVSSFGFEAPAEKPSSSTDAAAVPGAALREKRSPAGKAKASASGSGAAPKAEPNVRSAKGRPVHFGPQTCHVTQLRQRQAAEQARRKAETERRDAELTAAKTLLAAKKPHRKTTAVEKEARKRAKQLLRACEKKGRQGLGGGGSAEVQRSAGLEAVVKRERRGELSNATDW